MKQRKTLVALLIAAFSLGTCPYATAQVNTSNVAVAELLFKEGLALTKAGKDAEACPKFEKSNELDPAPNTVFKLAQCYEKVGRVASAWVRYLDLVAVYKTAKDPDREKYCREQAQNLEARVPRLNINVPLEAKSEGLHIHRNGEAIEEKFWGQPIPVDPGVYSITATAPGKKTWEETQTITEGAIVPVQIPKLEDLPKTVEPKVHIEETVKKPVVPPQPNQSLRYAAFGTGALGLGGIVVGSVYGVRAMSQWDEAVSHCNGTIKGPCDAQAREPEKNANTSASISTAGFIVGSVSAAAAVVLWLVSTPRTTTEPRASFLFVPSVGRDHASTTVRIEF